MTSLYHAVGGSDVLIALATRWHELCLEDPVARHPFSHAPIHPQHVQRLAAYWGEALGGPPAYTSGLGLDESGVTRMHACNGEHVELDELCIGLFERARADVGLPAPTPAPQAPNIRWATEQMRRYAAPDAAVPDGLPLPRWSWDGG